MPPQHSLKWWQVFTWGIFNPVLVIVATSPVWFFPIGIWLFLNRMLPMVALQVDILMIIPLPLICWFIAMSRTVRNIMVLSVENDTAVWDLRPVEMRHWRALMRHRRAVWQSGRAQLPVIDAIEGCCKEHYPPAGMVTDAATGPAVVVPKGLEFDPSRQAPMSYPPEFLARFMGTASVKVLKTIRKGVSLGQAVAMGGLIVLMGIMALLIYVLLSNYSKTLAAGG